MDTIVVYSPQNSPRLQFVLNWLFKERLQLHTKLINIIEDIQDNKHLITYGKTITGAINIPDQGLLWEVGIKIHKPNIGKWDGIPTLFFKDENDEAIPFDIFSSIFFLLSRYEEYYPFVPDKHDRYPASESILFHTGCLERPIIDEWVAALRRILVQKLGLSIPEPSFTYLPTYDIDIAYSHLYKGIRRIFGAYMRALLRMDLVQIAERTRVLKKRQKDPYDSFRWLRQVHKSYNYKPIYFILCATKTTDYDKNIHPHNPAMMRVIKNAAKDGDMGIHPSYFSHSGDITRQEIAILQSISNQKIVLSRQHYIKLKIPETYYNLTTNKITADYSMGYGSKLGFRAGTGSSFFWYDIEREQQTALRIFPFCFMDTTAHYELKLTPKEAMERLESMTKILKTTGSQLITIFHNFSLGTSSEWNGWRQLYEQFLQENKQ